MSKRTHYFIFRLQEKITRIIICSGKQALNPNKFHPPSKQPIAAHLPPFLKHPELLGAQAFPASHTQPSSLQVCSAGARSKQAQHQAPREPQVKATPREKEARGRGEGEQRHPTTFSICLAHLRVDPILSSNFRPCDTTYMASQGRIQGSREHALGMMK